MKKIKITFDLERSRRTFKKYYDYERKRELEKFPILLLCNISAVFILIGIFLWSDIWFFLGLILLGLMLVFLLFQYVRFQMAFTSFSNALEKRVIESEHVFEFSFNSEGITTV